ncbi:MAG: hypothetical protein IKU73_00915 [Clostridia bacterium]|nr:hypothetical protein [Clostridia bacterium]
MMKRMLAALVLALAIPACALGEITMTELADSESGSRLVVFAAAAEAEPNPALTAINMQIGVRFAQEKAKTAMGRAGASLVQAGTLYQDGKIASMGLLWKGEQADGRDGCSAAGLTVSLETGMEIYLDELFTDYDSAIAAMEAIVEADVLDGMSDYMEYAELLPLPQDSYSIDERGLTVYWPEDRYRYFDGTSGSVTFYWHELADCIGEESPVYALAHPDAPYHISAVETQCMSGEMTDAVNLELGELLGNIAVWHPLADPDYTTDSLLYPLERERGFAVEIPKYAETDEEETPVSAIRASRISFAGLLTTGKTTDIDVLKLLGEPVMETVYDKDAAFDAMLEPGRSLYYEISGRVLQLHMDEEGVLSCVILRAAMPESLY